LRRQRRGKSVLVKCIAGIHEPDGGEIRWQGDRVRIRNPRDSAALGIEVVISGSRPLRTSRRRPEHVFGAASDCATACSTRTVMERAATQNLADLHVTTVRSVRLPIATLSGGQRQSVAVAKAGDVELEASDPGRAGLRHSASRRRGRYWNWCRGDWPIRGSPCS
jgi:D-xylose transport system permease protein